MLWIKALHVISVIAWMAGLLYLFRLFVYHVEEAEVVVRMRLEVWERKLLERIATPAMVATIGFGLAQLAGNWDYYRHQPWMHAKLALVVGLVATHVFAMKIRKQLIQKPLAYESRTLRMFNELPTLLMMGIVILVIVKPWAR
ncbi:MAG: CopD family protein [Candidatus Sericytochromatia bacterium]|nr:CopD family protein [Candidatus Sericytochromatia bacterium]